MSEDRYRVLQDAITKRRNHNDWIQDTYAGQPWVLAHEQNRHLDTVQAILDRHTPSTSADPFCQWCSVRGVRQPWPCPDVLTVETALRNMGAV